MGPELEAGTEIQGVLLLVQPWLSGSIEAGVWVSSWTIAGRGGWLPTSVPRGHSLLGRSL